MKHEYDKILYKGKYYGVMCIKHKNIELPIVMNWEDFVIVNNIDKQWKYNGQFIFCIHEENDNVNHFTLHRIIKAIEHEEDGTNIENKAIKHINRIGLDNRRENLVYDYKNKDTKENTKKKKRIITLPEDSGINANDLPTYVWYMKPNKSHGDRFIISIGDIKWKTTSSKNFSLKYKLEEAKEYLRQLRIEKPELFEDYSMNGDFTIQGKELLNSYYDIVHTAGYEYIKRVIPRHNTDKYIDQVTTDKFDLSLLRNQGNLVNREKKRRVKTNLPVDCGVMANDLPSYAYYRPAYKNRGDYFIVQGHPNQDKIFQTTTSKNVTIKEKYDQMMDYYNKLVSNDETSEIK